MLGKQPVQGSRQVRREKAVAMGLLHRVHLNAQVCHCTSYESFDGRRVAEDVVRLLEVRLDLSRLEAVLSEDGSRPEFPFPRFFERPLHLRFSCLDGFHLQPQTQLSFPRVQCLWIQQNGLCYGLRNCLTFFGERDRDTRFFSDLSRFTEEYSHNDAVDGIFAQHQQRLYLLCSLTEPVDTPLPLLDTVGIPG